MKYPRIKSGRTKYEDEDQETGFDPEEAEREHERQKVRFGYVELRPENQIGLELYNRLSIPVIGRTILGSLILEEYREEIQLHGGWGRLAEDFALIEETIRDHHKEQLRCVEKGGERRKWG